MQHAKPPTANVRSLLALTFSLAAGAPAFAATAPGDWPCWRGPDRDNASKESAWQSAGAEEPLWQAEIGSGYSVPVVSAGRVYTVGYFPNPDTPRKGVDRVQCFDASSGEARWSLEFPADAYDNEHAGGAISTPTFFKGHLFVASRGGEVRAIDASNGALIWKVDLVERHGVEPGRYGFSSSPFIHGERIVLNAGKTLALDRSSGATDWISDDYRANYSTVAPVTIGERECFAVFGEEGLVLIDAGDGEHVSQYEFRVSQLNVEGATPIALGERVLISSGYEQGIALVDFSGDEPSEIWRNRRMRTKMAGTTLWDGHLYGFDESMLKCMDLEGNELWRKRGLGHGALSVAGGRLLLTTSDGELVVAAASPEEYREEYRRDILDGGVFWAPPILVDGRIYFRGSLGQLLCLDHRAIGQAQANPSVPTTPGELPKPADLLARHFKAAGTPSRSLEGLTLSGSLQNDSVGLGIVDATWTFGPRNLLQARFEMPPYAPGFMDRFFDGEVAWDTSPARGVKIVEGLDLEELLSTNGLRTFLSPLDPSKAKGVTREAFYGVDCFRVDEQRSPEVVRHVYFDAATGLYVGRASKDEATVLFSDWREVDGFHVPFERRMFRADNGEELRWRFTEAAFGEVDLSGYERPSEFEEVEEELETPDEDDQAPSAR